MTAAEGAGDLLYSGSAVASARLEQIVRGLIPDLLGYFTRRLEDREDAVDAVAETLLVLWRRERSIPSDPEEARRYAFGVARHVLSTTRRASRRRIALADRLRSEVREQTADAAVDVELRAALRALPERDRELVLLVAWEGFTVAAAGRMLGLRPEAARARYSRVRARLRESLSPAGE